MSVDEKTITDFYDVRGWTLIKDKNLYSTAIINSISAHLRLIRFISA